ncbi:MAG: hypothetical protein JRJ85_05335 [Deltaproteobacteria bacterium]|nr:hypothetical protein [Deltaproteobacteria bacterium]
MANKTKLEAFYDNLQTLPGLIGKLGLSVAEAQRMFDQSYIESLKRYLQVLSTVRKQGDKVEDYLTLLKDLAPSRIQFTETTAEVRADLQMTSMSEFKIGGEVGIKASIFAVTVNASYTRRSAYDASASAMIRTVMHAVPASEAVLDKLLARTANIPHVDLPDPDRYKALAEAFTELLKLLPEETPAPPPGG